MLISRGKWIYDGNGIYSREITHRIFGFVRITKETWGEFSICAREDARLLRVFNHEPEPKVSLSDKTDPHPWSCRLPEYIFSVEDMKAEIKRRAKVERERKL